MSSASGSGGQYSQRPSGNRSTGAVGGAQGKFYCRNWQRPDHPKGVVIAQNGGLCSHCQCDPREQRNQQQQRR